jgi:CheY-like chemotaxis protein
MAKVLVIDDSMFMRMQLVEILKAGGHQVAQVGDSREGLALAHSLRSKLDCIVLDLLMPNLDGLEFLEAMRRQGLATPVIVHTADIQATTRDRCLALGASEFLNKPPKKEELLAHVARLAKAGR